MKNAFKITGPTCSMTVSSERFGQFEFLFDVEDLPRISVFDWHIHKNGKNFYAGSNLRSYPTAPGAILLHRLITSFEWPIVDHVNNNSLDNRKINLRRASIKENCRNGVSLDLSSGYKGVQLSRDTRRAKPFSAKIKVDGKYQYLGRFATAQEGALAYNEAAVKYFGEFACLNVIEDSPTSDTYSESSLPLTQ